MCIRLSFAWIAGGVWSTPPAIKNKRQAKKAEKEEAASSFFSSLSLCVESVGEASRAVSDVTPSRALPIGSFVMPGRT